MRELIRSGWNAPRPAGAPGRGWRDWLLVAVVVAAAVAEGVLRNDLPSPAAVPVLIGIGLAPTLLWRRNHPLLMVAIAFPVCALGEVLVGVANTALMGLRDVHKGYRVLVNGASGGVGTFAVQLAKAFGAEVTAVCSPRNVELVRELGADHVIDYTTEDFTKSGQRYDVVFDLVGNRTLTDLRRCMTRAGTLILSGGGVSKGGSLVGPMGLIIRGMAVGRFVRQKVVVLVAVPSADNLATLTELIEAGQVVPVLDRTYPLERAADAIRYLEVEHARAKVVLVQEES